MGYLPPNSPIFRRSMPSARGPGVHTDEASSALSDIADLLPFRVAETLEDQVPGGPSEVRPNPPEDDDRGVIVAQRELMPLAYLVTGQWGPDTPEHNRRRLPVAGQARANPRDPRGFWARMAELAAEIESLRTTAAKRYRQQGKTGGPWTDQLAKMAAAVAFVRRQEGVAGPKSVLSSAGPLGMTWGVVAKSGNKKLPFAAYSELPMATCPGAGDCGVPLAWEAATRARKRGKAWCYSFKAFRYPAAFARQFLNTLAAYADREFAIELGGGASLPADDYAGRVMAALRGGARPEGRLWPQYVKGMVLKATKVTRQTNRPTFLRLFVDGDLNTEDTIVAWMQAVAEIGPAGRDIASGERHIDVYGYSKCWNQLLNADRLLGGKWPANYTLNLSSGSVYAASGYAEIRAAVEKLPITRGYFEAIPLNQYLQALDVQTRMLAQDPSAVVPMPPPGTTPFPFDAARVRAFLRINGIRSIAEAQSLLPDLPVPVDAKGRVRNLTLDQIRQLAYEHYLDRLLADPVFGAVVRREALRDVDPSKEGSYYDKYEANQKAILAKNVAKGDQPVPLKNLRDKALALALHEVLWSFGIGGACPLLCGSCSSHPTDPKLGAHRCADRTVFQGRVIHIGLH